MWSTLLGDDGGGESGNGGGCWLPLLGDRRPSSVLFDGGSGDRVSDS